ncbi:MAG: class II fructose-bisphosphate aldolase [Weeksellaceae bacterium]|jgi:fructose-bisphosphate aldolase class II|nr:class II fructose-bisphosphate aldolase [Weeksellaceae bacterium]
MDRKFPAGIATGSLVQEIIQDAKENGYALPACNVIGSSSVNAAMEAAVEVNSPLIIQFSNGGAVFNAGKGLKTENHFSAVKGAVAGALHLHELAEAYGATIILHTDHCAKNLLPWMDGMMEANENHYRKNGKALFSSHMLDLSEEPLEENMEISKRYLDRMTKIGITLEVELGITGGEEDGVDNTNVDNKLLYTQPEEVAYVYEQLKSVSDNFWVAAAFGNVHGVYKPGNVILTPKILDNSQKYIEQKFNTQKNPVDFVFHGGSGSSLEEIREAISYGVIKMNIDTDLQFAFMEGVRQYFDKNKDYLQSQIGNPEGEHIPNKKKYDPRVWLRQGELSFKNRLIEAFGDLNNVGRLA